IAATTASKLLVTNQPATASSRSSPVTALVASSFAHTHLDRSKPPICQRAWVLWMQPFGSYEHARRLRGEPDARLDDVPQIVAVNLRGQRMVATHHELAQVV